MKWRDIILNFRVLNWFSSDSFPQNSIKYDLFS
jgi:hypothetical protein